MDMSDCASESPPGLNAAAAADLDGDMSINRTVKRAFGTLESSPVKLPDISREEIDAGHSDSVVVDSHVCENERLIRRRIDLQESEQSESLELSEQQQQYSNHPLLNDSRPFCIDFSGSTDQERELENFAAMDTLRQDIISFRTERRTSEAFQLKFGDWMSIRQSLQNVADTFKSDSMEARRLRELSLCSDSKAVGIFNIHDTSYLIKKAFDIVQKEFFPDLPAVEDEQYWTSMSKKRKRRKRAADQDHSMHALHESHHAGDGLNHPQTDQNASGADQSALIITSNEAGSSVPNLRLAEIVDDYVPNPRMKILIQNVESNSISIIELRNKEWFTVRDLRALFDSIIKCNSSVFKFDAEVRAIDPITLHLPVLTGSL
jgi:hypothetical protein